MVFSINIRLKSRYPTKKVSNCTKPIEVDVKGPGHWFNLTIYENRSFRSLVSQTA